MLTRSLCDDFPQAARLRGEEYLKRDRVSVEAGSEHSVLAFVSGLHDYVVELWRKGDEIAALCGCPHFVDEGPCPHLWAALLAADRKGLLRAGDAPARLRLQEHPDADSIRELGMRDAALDMDLPELPHAFHETLAAEPAPLPPPEPAPAPRPAAAAPPAPRARDWRRLARELAGGGRADGAPSEESPLPSGAQLAYVLDLQASREQGALVVGLAAWRAKDPAKALKLALRREAVASLPDAADRAVVAALAGAAPALRRSALQDRTEHLPRSFRLDREAHQDLVRAMARSGRAFVRASEGAPLQGPVEWIEEGAHVRLRLQPDDADAWTLHADFAAAAARCAAGELLLAAPGFVVLDGPRLAPLRDEWGHRFLVDERLAGPLRIPAAELSRAAALLAATPGVPPLDAPAGVAHETRSVAPRPRLVVRRFGTRAGLLAGELSFDYDGCRIDEDARESAASDPARRLVFPRDRAAEDAARATLRACRVRQPRQDDRGERPWLLSPRRLPDLVTRLVSEGWIVEAEGRRQKAPGRVTMRVRHDGDWLELHGEVEFERTSCSLPEILRALQKREPTVRLADGSSGLLPEEWLQRHAPWLSLGKLRRDHVRFAPSQASLLDALLEASDGSQCDDAFAALRTRLRAFEGIVPEPQPAGFQGTLRDYQRHGLGWMRFLRETGFGGCLADDMGVGKTAQVLGMLAARHAEVPGKQRRPTLIVVPRSLIFNWKQEAARFVPHLKVVDHSGSSRSLKDAARADVVLCTYGTMRRDIAALRALDLDYAILDEAQAIKNAGTSAAKSARLLRARHRLALSGTPIENHLGELWSLFEFLNPGMLGRASAFKPATGTGELKPSDRELLARAIRPFLLRRTKGQVARELPPRTEQTIRCALSPTHRRQYDELRTHYRRELLGRVESDGMAASRMHVLEALLRLRQLSCHPGLIDPARFGEPSAKLDLLVDRLCELAEEGHKALCFSQFTTFLKIVRDRLEARGMALEYLDGSTTDRQERVARFQSDADCRAFLISLKAGGTGLNLTAADYVFLLDPWWNPAAEAQAIDRSHRMGQTRQVFAYRLIAADTVEERVLEMQAEKRALAEALLGGNASLLGDLKRADLELLLS